MAEHLLSEEEKAERNRKAGHDEVAANDPPPDVNDPGGAHIKGYSADPRPEPAVSADGPVPLADGPSKHPAFHQPEREGKVNPTGRSEPHEYGPNDRLMGSDR